MATIRHRPVRIIAHENDQTTAVHSRRPRRDYAWLARHGRSDRPDEEPSLLPIHGKPCMGLSLHPETQGDTEGGQDQSDSSDDGMDEASAALRKRLRGALRPLVTKILRTQNQMLELVGKLAHEIATFCGDRAINDSGTWEAYLPLDASVLQQTTLHLTLSYLTLSLRFDTTDDDSKRLLLAQAPMLERELDTLLRAWGTPREIQLTIW